MLAMLDRSILISMPTKCGTERLKSTLVRRCKVAEELPEDHGWKQYPEHNFKERWLLVRDPLERWVSTYWWLKSTDKNQGFSKIVGKHLHSFNAFARLIASQPSQAFVFQPLRRYIQEFQPTRLVPLEQLLTSWCDYFPSEYLPEYQKAAPHTTRGKKSCKETIKHRLPDAFMEYIIQDYDILPMYFPYGWLEELA